MKPSQVLIFFVAVFAMLGVLWLAVPAEGVPVGPINVRFASYQRTLEEVNERKVDVDSVLATAAARFAASSLRRAVSLSFSVLMASVVAGTASLRGSR